MAYPDITVTGSRMPSNWMVSSSIEVVKQFSEQTPARLRIQFKNDASTSREFLFGPDAPFGPLRGASPSTARLHVLPDDETNPTAGAYSKVIPSHPVGGCWQLADRYDILDRGLIWQADLNATTAMTYVVLDDPDNEECLPSGTYPFEGEWGERYEDTTDEWFKWQFELILER